MTHADHTSNALKRMGRKQTATPAPLDEGWRPYLAHRRGCATFMPTDSACDCGLAERLVKAGAIAATPALLEDNATHETFSRGPGGSPATADDRAVGDAQGPRGVPSKAVSEDRVCPPLGGAARSAGLDEVTSAQVVSPAPLDVERLARALHRTQTGHVPLDDLSCCRGWSYTEWAVDLAREYAKVDDHA
jgi:hypothetical protein